MNQGNFSGDKTTNEDFLRTGDRLKGGEDLMTFRMSPPTAFDGLADDHLRKPRNGAFT